MINLLPAVLIGGPVHTEKPLLFDSLTGALRSRHVVYHALRICPPGEDVRSQEYEQTAVRLLHINDSWTDELTERLCLDLSQRLVPLLIDVSACPSALQTRLFQHCTHTILLFHEDDQAGSAFWSRMSERYGLLPLAQFSLSAATSISPIMAQETIISGAPVRAVRDSSTYGTPFDCLLERITTLFTAYTHEELLWLHLHQAPTALVLHLPPLLSTLFPGALRWEPQMLSTLLDYVPAHTALSAYGPAPQWLYGALATHAGEQAFYQFDPCLPPGEIPAGWVASPALPFATLVGPAPAVYTDYTRGAESGTLTVRCSRTGLDYLRAASMPFPPVPPELGLVLAGDMPIWLITALIRLYMRAGVAWIACQLAGQNAAVTIFSRIPHRALGEITPTL